MGMRLPAEVYQNSARKFEGTPEDLNYEPMAARRVQVHGKIGWQGQRFFIGTALQGWSVGIEATGDPERCNVWFGRLLLGQLDPLTASFEPTLDKEEA